MRSLVAVLALGLSSVAHAQGVTATFNTTTRNGQFAPQNCVAVWVENANGGFVKTIGRWSGAGGPGGDRTIHLVAWRAKAGAADADAVSGATRLDHAAPLSVQWDLKDRANAIVPDGTYTIRMEMTEDNATQAAQNNQGTFTFAKGTSPQSQTGLSNNGFVGVDIQFDPAAACSNGTIDPGETCDPPGSCPTSCPASTDACMENVLVGTAATCTAVCQLQPIADCTDADLSGGCASARPSALLALLVLAILARRRR